MFSRTAVAADEARQSRNGVLAAHVVVGARRHPHRAHRRHGRRRYGALRYSAAAAAAAAATAATHCYPAAASQTVGGCVLQCLR